MFTIISLLLSAAMQTYRYTCSWVHTQHLFTGVGKYFCKLWHGKSKSVECECLLLWFASTVLSMSHFFFQYVCVLWICAYFCLLVCIWQRSSNVLVHPVDGKSFGISVRSFSQSLNYTLPCTLRRRGRTRDSGRRRRWWRRRQTKGWRRPYSTTTSWVSVPLSVHLCLRLHARFLTRHSGEPQKRLHGNECRHGPRVLHWCRQHIAKVGVEVLLIVGGQTETLEPSTSGVTFGLLHQSAAIALASLRLGHNYWLDKKAAAVTHDPRQPGVAE